MRLINFFSLFVALDGYSLYFDISLDIMVLWLLVDFSFDIYTFFDVHAVGWHAVDLYAQLSHIISFCQLNHASQGR